MQHKIGCILVQEIVIHLNEIPKVSGIFSLDSLTRRQTFFKETTWTPMKIIDRF